MERLIKSEQAEVPKPVNVFDHFPTFTKLLINCKRKTVYNSKASSGKHEHYYKYAVLRYAQEVAELVKLKKKHLKFSCTTQTFCKYEKYI